VLQACSDVNTACWGWSAFEVVVLIVGLKALALIKVQFRVLCVRNVQDNGGST
jgi:hypothetical protein